jgi:tRNA-modifying protein YgfZ
MLDPRTQADYDALTQSCGWVAVERALIEVRGADRAQFLHSFCTNDVKRLTPGQGCEALVTSHQGKVLGHIFVHCEADRLVLDSVAGQAGKLIEHFSRFVISEDVEFRDASGEIGTLVVAGKDNREVWRALAATEPPAGPLESAAIQIGEQPAKLRSIPAWGRGVYFVHAGRSALPSIGERLSAAQVRACEAAALECLRVEAGFPLFGRDITENNLPQELNRDQQAISFKKGCYLGQETVARIDALGHVNRLLVGVRFEGPSLPAAGEVLRNGDKEVGRVTAAAWSPRLAAPLALAYVRSVHSQPGTRLDSAAGSAEIVRLPVA